MPIPSIDPSTAERQTLDEIRGWHRGVVDALVAYRASVQEAIRTGSQIAPRFAGMTEAEVDSYYEFQRRELDRLTVLNLVASTEATIRIDFFRRVGEKLKDRLSRAYQTWHKKLAPEKQMRPDFDVGGILEILKDTRLLDNYILGRYRECLISRHWVGHGRWWARPVEMDRLDPDEVYDRANALLKAMPA